jgi:hypothetical protein
MRIRPVLVGALWLGVLAQSSLALECASSPAIATCLKLDGPGYNIVNHHGRRTHTWSMKIENTCAFAVKGRLAFANGTATEIVFQGSTTRYESCSDDCRGALSVTPICGWAPAQP